MMDSVVWELLAECNDGQCSLGVTCRDHNDGQCSLGVNCRDCNDGQCIVWE